MLSKLKALPKEDFLSFLGGLIYIRQLWFYAHLILSRLDESAYVYKGYLFATGVYRPFQPYGVWTNKAPLAFLIPGYIQAWFGPGLRTARYFSVLIGFLILLGVWYTTRRLGGKKWAVAVVWAFVFMPAISKMYSPALSQGLIALMLTGVLSLSLGGDRPIWQLSLSAALAGLMLLTRQNMVLVLPILVLYIFWQYGRKAGFWSLFSGAMVVILGHLYWWPEIMELWAHWLPDAMRASIRSLYIPAGGRIGSHGGGFTPDFSSRVSAFFLAFRLYPVILIGVITSFFLWPKEWKDKNKKKDAIFLSILYVVLFLMHAWASLGKNYCVYCFPSYLAFFHVSGIFLIVISTPSWKKEVPKYLIPFLIILVLVLSTGIGFSASEDIGNTLFKLQVPRIKEGQFLAGQVELKTLLLNKFELSQKLTKQYFAVATGFTIGILFLASLIVLQYTYFRKKKIDFGYLLLTSFLVFSFTASPIIAGKEPEPAYGQSDMISSYEEAGDYLVQYIPSGSTVYWNGGNSLLPLLSIPGGVEIYPSQFNAYNNYRNGGDADSLLRMGFWNNALDQQWKSEADYIVVINYTFDPDWKDFLSSSEFEEFPRSTTLLENNPDAFLRVFRRK